MDNKKKIISKTFSGLLIGAMLVSSVNLNEYSLVNVYADEKEEITSDAFSYSESFEEDGVTVSIYAEENVVPEGAEVLIIPLSDKEEKKVSSLAEDTLDEYAQNAEFTEADQHSAFYRYKNLDVDIDKTYSYDITFTYLDEDGNTKTFEPQGDTVQVEISVEGLEEKVADEMTEAELLHIDDSLKDAEVEEIGLTVEDDTIDFDADHFSIYSLVIAETTANTSGSEVDAYTKIWTLIQDYAKPEDYLADPLASSYTDAQKAEMKASVDEAISGCTTDAEKTRAIYTYVADRIYYDYIYLYDTSIGTNTSPYAVWYYKNTVCAGYARLTRALCIIEGIPAMDIIGDNHEYNAVYLTDESRWIFMDTTWGSPNMYKKDSDGNASWIKGTTINYKYYASSTTCISSLNNHEVYELTNLSDDNFYYNFNCDYTSGWWNSDYSVWQLEKDWHISAKGEKAGTDLTQTMPAKKLDDIPLTVIGNGVYYNNTEITSLDFSDYPLEVLYFSSFHGCTNLKSIKIPSTVSMIGSSCFYNCTSLESITLPAAVKTINSYAFYNCNKLTSINLKDTALTEIGTFAFYSDSMLTSIELPSTFKTMGDYAFDSCEGLTSVDMSKTKLTEIPDYAFYGNKALRDVDFPTSLTKINESAFASCDALNCIDFSGINLTSIGQRAFASYTSSEIDTVVLTSMSEDDLLSLSSDYNSETYTSPWHYRNLSVGTYLYTIRYDGNGATSGTMASTITAGEAEVSLRENTFSKENNYFSCWNTMADGSGSEYLDGQVVKGLGSSQGQVITLYAQWSNSKYQVNFLSNSDTVTCGVSGSMSAKTYACGKQCSLPACSYTAEGYHFAGWNTRADGSGTAYTPGTTLQALSNTNGAAINLYAIWSLNRYTIHFDANGGTGSMADIIGESYEDLTLPRNTFTKQEFVFVGWNTDSEATWANYRDGVEINHVATSDNEVITYYAVWTQNPTYTVTLDTCCSLILNPNTFSVIDGYDYGDLPDESVMKRAGYSFAGWYTAPNGGSYVVSYSLLTQNADHTLYAHWDLKTFVLCCDLSDEGTINIDSGAYTVIPNDREGYTFTGWYYDKDNDGKNETKIDTLSWQGFADAGIDLNEKIGNYLYLQSGWKALDYKISFDVNGGDALSSSSITVAYGAQIPTFSTPTKTGYQFDGWCDSNGNRVSLGSTYFYTNDFNLKASWLANSYTIVFSENGGSGYMSSLELKYGSSMTLEANTFKRSNYTFTGWNTRADGKGSSYKNKASVKNLSSTDGDIVTLYAQWKAKSYSIKYKLNGGKNSSKNPKNYTYLSKTIKLAKPTKKGYTFVGWYSDKKCKHKVTAIKKGSSGNKTLYAKWKKK